MATDPNLSLPLKYRPMVFEDLVGQEVIAKYLATLSLRGQAKNLITYGAFGTGKTTSSRIYSRALNCTNLTPTGSPCNQCEACLAHIEGRYSDFLEVDAASQSGIEHIKKLHDIAKVPPLHGKFRIILVDEAQSLSSKAWDVLLKIIEEPPPYLCFLFSTTEKEKIRPAIVSRCQELEVKTLSQEQSLSHLKKICSLEGYQYEESALALISFISKGHPRSLLKNLEQCVMYDDLTAENVSKVLNLGYVAEILRFTRGWQANSLPQMRAAISAWGAPPQDFVRVLQEFLLYLIYNTIRSQNLTVNPVFASIPKEELTSLYQWLLHQVSPTIEGGVPQAILNLISHLSSHPVENEISLDILLYSLNQLAHEHNFQIAKYGRPSEVVSQTTSQEAPRLSQGRGRQFTRVARDHASRLRAQDPQLTPQQTPPPTPTPQPKEPKPIYAHNLDEFGFTQTTPASQVISL